MHQNNIFLFFKNHFWDQRVSKQFKTHTKKLIFSKIELNFLAAFLNGVDSQNKNEKFRNEKYKNSKWRFIFNIVFGMIARNQNEM